MVKTIDEDTRTGKLAELVGTSIPPDMSPGMWVLPIMERMAQIVLEQQEKITQLTEEVRRGYKKSPTPGMDA